MLTYKNFKNIIESVKVVDETIYNDLIKNNSISAINNYFEMYMNDESVIENNDKYNRIRYYIDICLEQENNLEQGISSDYELTTEENKKDLDLVKLYLREAGSFKLLTKEEEYQHCKKIQDLEKEVKKNKITLENINKRLEKHGYEEQKFKDNTIKSIEKKIQYISNIIDEINKISDIDNKTILEQMNELKKLLKDIKLYYEYQSQIDSFLHANLRLVIHNAKMFQNRGIEFLDLIQEGNLGLKKAIEKFEVNKENKFSTYATYWIKQSIRRAIAERSRPIKVPSYFAEVINKIKIIIVQFELTKHRKPTDEEIIQEFYRMEKEDLIKEGNPNPTKEEIEVKANRITIEKINQAKMLNQELFSLSDPIKEDGDSNSMLGDFIPDSKTSVEDEVMYNFTCSYVSETLSILNKKELLITILRFGLKLDEYMNLEDFVSVLCKYKNSKDEIKKCQELYINICNNPKKYTLEYIGKIFDVTRERIRQVEKKSLKKLVRKANRDNILYGTNYYNC